MVRKSSDSCYPVITISRPFSGRGFSRSCEDLELMPISTQELFLENVLSEYGIAATTDNVCRLAFKIWEVTRGRLCGWASGKYNSQKPEIVGMSPEDGIYRAQDVMIWRHCPETVEARRGDRCLWLGRKESLFELSDARNVAQKIIEGNRTPFPMDVETLAHVLHRVANRPFVPVVDHIVIKRCGPLAFGRRGLQEEFSKHREELLRQADRENFVRYLLLWFGIKDTPNARVKLDARIKEWLDG